MNKDELKEYVQTSNLVNMKDVGNGLYVLRYKKKVFYDNLWNEYLEECRGTIVDKDFNVVSRPFTKIYNYGIEEKAPKLSEDTLVTAYRKVNGFMVAMTWHNDNILVSTTGSTSGDFVDMAKEMMLTHGTWVHWQEQVKMAKGHTLMFECVHPNDPHIIVEDVGMYFLGVRENTWDSKVNGFGNKHIQWARNYALEMLHCYYPEAVMLTLGDLLVKVKTVRHEGVVFYTEDGVSSKIKSPFYLTSKWVARNPRTDKLVDLKKDIKHNLDEEYYGLVDAIRANIVKYTAMDEQQRLAWVREHLGE